MAELKGTQKIHADRTDGIRGTDVELAKAAAKPAVAPAPVVKSESASSYVKARPSDCPCGTVLNLMRMRGTTTFFSGCE